MFSIMVNEQRRCAGEAWLYIQVMNVMLILLLQL